MFLPVTTRGGAANASVIEFTILTQTSTLASPVLYPAQNIRFAITDLDGPNNEAIFANCSTGPKFMAVSKFPASNLTVTTTGNLLRVDGTANQNSEVTSTVIYEYQKKNTFTFTSIGQNSFLKEFDLNYNNFLIPNPQYYTCSQNSDSDAINNATDLDDDNDGITDIVESGGNNPDGDADGDGLPNYLDTFNNLTLNVGYVGDGSVTNYTDTNNDGIPNVYDFDGDGIPNHLDSDSDNDGCLDVYESTGFINSQQVSAGQITGTTNANGIPTLAGTGFGSGASQNASLNRCNDNDLDGVPNGSDLDNDNDGILDSVEGLCATTGFEGFDSPSQATTNGNNIQNNVTVFNNWAVKDISPAQPSPFNIIKVSGGTYTAGPATAQSGDQYLDINAAGGTLYRDFTLTTPTVLNASVFFSPRETQGTTITFNSSISVARIVSGTETTVANGNVIPYSGTSPYVWTQSSVNNVVLPAGTYRIQMVVHNNAHVDSISYCFSRDTDGDGIPDYLDVDSDNDGCPDAVEGSESVRITQVHRLDIPITNLNYTYRGQIKVLANGTTTGTPAQIVSNVSAANGVPQLVNNAAGNPAGIGAGVADNTENPNPTADIGQGLGFAQNSSQQDPDCTRCFRPATTPGVGGLATNHGITALSRAGSAATEWPGKIKGAYTAIDAKTKGFVINRLTSTQVNDITAAGNAVKGMAVYDTTLNCLRIYDGNAWNCYNKQTCDDFN